MTTWCAPRSAAPHTAAAIASVAPLVNTTSRLRAPRNAATRSRASSTATRARQALGVDASRVTGGVAQPRIIAATAAGRSGEVDAWSR